MRPTGRGAGGALMLVALRPDDRPRRDGGTPAGREAFDRHLYAWARQADRPRRLGRATLPGIAAAARDVEAAGR